MKYVTNQFEFGIKINEITIKDKVNVYVNIFIHNVKKTI